MDSRPMISADHMNWIDISCTRVLTKLMLHISSLPEFKGKEEKA